MSGNTISAEMTPEQMYALIVGNERSEFGFARFNNPCVQEQFESKEREYRLKLNLKEAYDGQEMLRKMRTDIKREYLTRKKQLKKLQMRAAVTFRNAEITLQEHYSEMAGQGSPYHHSVDINSPLVTVVELPRGGSFNLKQFDFRKEFEKLREQHASSRQDEWGRITRGAQKRHEDAAAINDRVDDRAWYEKSPATSGEEEESGSAPQIRGAFGGCYDESDPAEEKDYDIREACEARQARGAEEHGRRWGMWEEDCFSIRDGSDGDGDSDSYDSSYCAEFGYYPREYNYEREIREAEEAAAAAAAEQERLQENMRDVDGEPRDNKDPREIPWDEWVAGGHVSEKCLGCGNLECSDCYSDDDNDSDGNDDNDDDNDGGNNDDDDDDNDGDDIDGGNNDSDDNDSDDDGDDNDATETVAIPEVAAPVNGGIICAKKKAVAAASAAKARREKQQRKKDAAKFVPFKITINTNRENATEEVLYVGRAQINHPKKMNRQQVVARTEDEARKAKKRDAAKWKRLNANLKQTAARGTKVAILPDPRPWYNNENYFLQSDDY
jgi:hypothetical protein